MTSQITNKINKITSKLINQNDNKTNKMALICCISSPQLTKRFAPNLLCGPSTEKIKL